MWYSLSMTGLGWRRRTYVGTWKGEMISTEICLVLNAFPLLFPSMPCCRFPELVNANEYRKELDAHRVGEQKDLGSGPRCVHWVVLGKNPNFEDSGFCPYWRTPLIRTVSDVKLQFPWTRESQSYLLLISGSQNITFGVKGQLRWSALAVTS